MKNSKVYVIIFICGFSSLASAQTSWIGSTNDQWKKASNWTAGVPNGTTDAIIGDTNFVGPHHPNLNTNGKCNNLTIGDGVDSISLKISKNLTVNGNLLIGSNGVINASKNNRTITIVGHWTNNGEYNATTSSAQVTFSGSNQTISGVSSFQKLRINSSSTLTLASDISVNNSLDVYGSLNPTIDYEVGGSGSLEVFQSGEIKVFAANFVTNYPISGSIQLDNSSIVNYASASITQYISSSLTYGWLRVSGGSTKELTADLPDLQSATSNAGRIYVDAGILDLKSFTANRASGSGGAFLLGAGTTLRIGGNNTFPDNYNSKSISTTSTVEYYGLNQSVKLLSYGNLILSGSSGTVVKTMPAGSFIVYGNFTASKATSDSVSFTLLNSIDIRKDVSISQNVTFNGGSYNSNYSGNWSNDGRFKGSTSISIFKGVGSNLSGTGINSFYELHFTSGEITADSVTLIKVNGDLKTYSGGGFSHSDGGTLLMAGTSKQITGDGFSFYNLNIGGTISTSDNLNIRGDLNSSGSFTANNGTVNFLGNNKLILGSGIISFSGLNIFQNIDAQNDFTLTGNWFISSDGSFQMPAGNITFDGSSTLSGNADIDSLTINSSKTLIMGTSSRFGIAGAFVRNGVFDASTYPPNTIDFNAGGNQNVNDATYHHLILSNGGTKSVAGNLTVRGNLNISSGATMDGATYTLIVYKDWINEGVFTPSTSDVSFQSNNISNVTGSTTFYNLTVNKSSSTGFVYLKSDVTTSHINMTQGILDTDTSSITTTIDRTGGGYIYGTVTHAHSFSDATSYYFESPYTSITFNTPSGISSVTIKCTVGEVADFDPTIESVDRQYEISINSGTYTSADLQLHYLDAELNAFEEPFLMFYKFNTGTTWDSLGFSTRNLTQDWVQYNSMTSVPGRYSLSGVRRIVRWNGSVSSAWETAANWTTISGSDMSNRVPDTDDAVQIGTATFTNQPTVNQPQEIAAMRFGSKKGISVILLDSLTINGSFKQSWDTLRSHTIDISTDVLHVKRNCKLSNGTSGNEMILQLSSGQLIIGGDLIQKTGSQINVTSGGKISLAGNFDYVGGVFNTVSGTFEYNGNKLQYSAPVSYDHLSFAKLNDIAIIDNATTVSGNLEASVGGLLRIMDTLDIEGNFTLGPTTECAAANTEIYIGGNWTNNGSFSPGSSTVTFDGSSNQTVDQNSFNRLRVNKQTDSLALTGNLFINSDLIIESGVLDLDTWSADRTSDGGSLTINNGQILVGGANNFPSNYILKTLSDTSVTIYNGTVSQAIASNISYGHLTFSNGASNAKTIDGDITVNGDMLISANSTVTMDSIRVNLYGDLTNSGSITPGKSTIVFEGSSKTISGPVNFNNIIVIGSYSKTGGAASISGNMFVETGGSLNFSSDSVSLDGDLTNKGTLISSGVATFTGTKVQNISLQNAISSASTGVVNFNGTVAPNISSTSSPQFATVNINNTAGISPSVPWYVFFVCNIASGSAFHGGPLDHVFYGSLINNGEITSSGTLTFTPGPPFSASSTIKLNGTSFTSTGDVIFGGSVVFNIIDNLPVFNNVIVSNPTGITPSSNWIINNELRVLSGGVFNGGTGTDHTIGQSILINGTINGQSSTVTFDQPASTIDGVGEANFGSLAVDTTSDLTLNAPIFIMDDLVVHGSMNSTGRLVSFTGTSASVIESTSGTVNFSELEINKTSSDVTLSAPVEVSEELILTSGILHTDATDVLTIADNAVCSEGNVSSFVDGPMTKIGNEAFIFPVGNEDKWARLGISTPSDSTDAFTVQYYKNAYTDTTTMATTRTPYLNNVSLVEYWICDRTAGTSNVKVELFWENTLYSGIGNYSPDLVVAKWNGTGWENYGQSAVVASAKGSITSDTVISFSPFTFGSLSPLMNTLPIELLRFEAWLDNDVVQLEWETLIEQNNDFFEIERSVDAVSWQVIDKINGAGNSNTAIQYQSIDKDPHPGKSYYRLKQTDYNGRFGYSDIVFINADDDAVTLLIYPIPTKDWLNIKGDWQNEPKFRIYSKEGLDHSHLVDIEKQSDKHYVIDVSRLLPGLYVIVDGGVSSKVLVY